jgi:transcriptional regulator with XRE-family HTH domain
VESQGERARRIRLKRGLSVAAIAAEAGVSDTTWTKYEHDGEVNQMSAVKIERALSGEASDPAAEMRLLREEVSGLRDDVAKLLAKLGHDGTHLVDG